MLKSPIFTWIEINLSAVEDNIKAVRAIAGVPVMAVVKANGYGHGAVEVSRAALAAGASWLAVSCAEEAIVLREAGITVPILVLGMVTAQEADEAIAAGLSLTVYCHESAELYSKRASALGRSVNVHLKVDSGMGRLGTLPGEQTLELARTIAGMPSVHLEGVFTHLACADEENPAPTNEQLTKFASTLEALAGERDPAGLDPRREFRRDPGVPAGAVQHRARRGGDLRRPSFAPGPPAGHVPPRPLVESAPGLVQGPAARLGSELRDGISHGAG